MRPSEIEEQFLFALDKLARTPLLAQTLYNEIGTDVKADKKLRSIGTNAELIRYYPLGDGSEIATSPLHAFEHPEKLVTLFENHKADRVREAFNRVRIRPGLPVLIGSSDPIIEDMIRLGLVPAPTVIGADKKPRAFAIMPYGLDPVYLTLKKQVLDRALALIACVRCGETSGGETNIKWPELLLAALKDPSRNYTLGGHSSTPGQYAPLISMGMIRPVHMYGDRFGARLVPTQDNLEAVDLACTLLKRQGEGAPERGNEREATKLLFTEGAYLAPLETIALTKQNSMPMSSTDLSDAWAQMRGWK